MGYIRRLLPLFLLTPLLAQGQTTSVSGTITDAGGQSWNYGSYSFFFVPSPVNPQGPYRWNGAPFNISQVISGSLNASGSFSSAQVPDNTFIFPSGSDWRLQVCPAATTACSSVVLTVSGASQNVTSSITPPTIVLNLGNPPPGAAAYTDSEVIGAKPGSFYYNINSNTLKMCSITSFPPCTWLAFNGSTITSFSAGNLSPLFTTSVATPTTTPALSFSLSDAAANTVFGRCAGTTGAPSFCTLTTAQLGNAPVTSVFGRTGAVVSATNDYSFSQISGTLLGSQFGPLTGDVTTSAYVATLANSGVTSGNCGSATTSCALSIDVKGRITSKTDTAINLGFTQITSGANSSVCTTGGGGGDTCTTDVTWDTPFADTNYRATCTGDTPTNYPLILGYIKTASKVTVTISDGTANMAMASTFAALNCIGIHP